MESSGIRKMDNETLTRREALQGMVGVAAASLLSRGVSGEPAPKGAAAEWPADTQGTGRLLAFNDDWRFHRGDATGAEAADFDDTGWRTLDVPHDWSIEDLPDTTDTGKGAIWTDGTNPVRIGPFDMLASQGQIATGWTVGGLGWYRRAFERPQVPQGGKLSCGSMAST